jgi:hypothetical protein
MWEYLPEDPGKPAYFTYQQGQSDGTTAYTNAAALRQPQGTPIYFAIDYDFDEDYVHGPLTQYFQGIKDAFTAQANPPAYTVGAYGSGLELTWLLQQGLSEYSWLAGISSDWQGNATFTAWNLNQTAEEAVCGVESADEDVSQGDFWKWQLFS